MINLKNLLVELEFKTPAEFATYKKKHKMRPGTVVKVAGKDKVVGDDKPKGKKPKGDTTADTLTKGCLLYTSPSPRDLSTSRMPSSA